MLAQRYAPERAETRVDKNQHQAYEIKYVGEAAHESIKNYKALFIRIEPVLRVVFT